MTYSFWLEGVAMPVISLMGLIGKRISLVLILTSPAGNIISILILTNNKSRLDLHPIFVSLCVCLVSCEMEV